MTLMPANNAIKDLLKSHQQVISQIHDALSFPDNFRDLAIKDETYAVWSVTDDDCILLGNEPDDLTSEGIAIEIDDFVRRPGFALVIYAPDECTLAVMVLDAEKEVR